jgi:hypothetical protein
MPLQKLRPYTGDYLNIEIGIDSNVEHYSFKKKLSGKKERKREK